jgi:ABC-type nitrate/sulfonate/bicarbonate transport system permease component
MYQSLPLRLAVVNNFWNIMEQRGSVRAVSRGLIKVTLTFGLSCGGGDPAAVCVRADPNLSHCADPILSQGW